jgi:hypothetical protein
MQKGNWWFPALHSGFLFRQKQCAKIKLANLTEPSKIAKIA